MSPERQEASTAKRTSNIRYSNHSSAMQDERFILQRNNELKR